MHLHLDVVSDVSGQQSLCLSVEFYFPKAERLFSHPTIETKEVIFP